MMHSVSIKAAHEASNYSWWRFLCLKKKKYVLSPAHPLSALLFRKTHCLLLIAHSSCTQYTPVLLLLLLLLYFFFCYSFFFLLFLFFPSCLLYPTTPLSFSFYARADPGWFDRTRESSQLFGILFLELFHKFVFKSDPRALNPSHSFSFSSVFGSTRTNWKHEF